MGFFRRFSDGLANIVSGLGTTNDQRIYGRYLFRPLDWLEIASAYRTSWMMRKGVNLPPYDMTRAGRDWQADKPTIALLEAEEKRLGIWAKLRLGLVYGRLGGGAMILGIGSENPALPINPRTIGKLSIRHATVWCRWQLTIGPKVTDPTSDFFGQPEYFKLNSTGEDIRIHPSRVIAFRGAPILPGAVASWEDEFWGDSVLQSVEDALKNADSAQNGFAGLIAEAKIDIYKIPGLTALAATEEFEKALGQRMRTSNLFKSQYNALIVDAGNGTDGSGEEWDQRQVTWAGIPEIALMYVALVAGAFDIPATRFMGKSPDGMNATGEGDENAYWAMISSLQESDLLPLIDRVDAVLIPSALGKTDDSIWWKFAPLRETTEKEEATNFNTTMDAVTKLQNTGAIPDIAFSKGVQNLLEERGWVPGLDDALGELPDDERFPESEPEPEELAPPAEPTKPTPRAVNDTRFTDAEPKSLYVRRDVLNVAEIAAWAKEQKLPPLQDGLHVTIVHIDQAFDWMKVEGEWNQKDDGTMEIAPGGVRIVEPLGDRTAVVLFTSSPLAWRHEQILRAAEAQDKFSSYQPHFSLTGEPVDLSNVVPYRGKIVLGPEIFEPVRTAQLPEND